MMRRCLLAGIGLLASPAAAQVVMTPALDLAARADLAAARADATAAKAQVDQLQGTITAMQAQLAGTATTSALTTLQSTVMAAMPKPSSSAPPMEAIGGAVGSSTTYRRADDVQPRISRTVSGVTGATGSASVAWAAMPGVPKLTVTPYVTATETKPPRCYPVSGTVTTTGATVRCYRDQTILGLGLLPSEVAPAGVAFDVLALPGS